MEPAKTILWPRIGGLERDCGYRAFADLANSLGYRLVTFGRDPSGPVDPIEWRNRLDSLIKSALGYVLDSEADICSPAITAEIKSQVRSGKRLVILSPHRDFNSFLNEFDLGFYSKKLTAITPSAATLSDGRSLILSVHEQENALCISMMQGNSELTVGCPFAVWYGKSASPFFVLPQNTEILSAGDFFEEGEIRKTTCGAVWPSGSSREHRILAFGGSIVSGPYQDLEGEIHPGIAANRVFAKNLLRWLVGELELKGDECGDLLQRVHSIEIALYDTIKAILQNGFGKDWWSNGVPLEIRKEAAKMSEERDGRVPKDGCLHFIDLKVIIEKRWRLFEAAFEGESKKDLLERLNQVNELRNRLSHPMRLVHEPISSDESALLEKHFIFFKKVADCVVVSSKPIES